MSLQMKLAAVTLDCADPLVLAAFYQAATGWEPHPKSDAEFAGLNRDDGLFIGFQRAGDYRPPQWPGQTVPQQLHLCFDVDDLDGAVARLLELGAGRPEFQPHDPAMALVLTDPAGHPFCVCQART